MKKIKQIIIRDAEKKARALPLTSVLLLLIIDVVDSSAMSSAMMFSLIFWIISCACKASCSSDFMRAWRQASRFFDLRDNKKKRRKCYCVAYAIWMFRKKIQTHKKQYLQGDGCCVCVCVSCQLRTRNILLDMMRMCDAKKKCFLNKIRSGHRV